MKQASKETRERAIASWKVGVPIDQICSVLNISRGTFYSWRKRDAEGGEQTPLPKSHKPAKLNDESSYIEQLGAVAAAKSSVKLGDGKAERAYLKKALELAEEREDEEDMAALKKELAEAGKKGK